MLERIASFPGERLDLETYLDHFEARLTRARSGGVWKLERRQHFRQPESKSWSAFARGSWEEALRAIDAAGPSAQNELGALAEIGVRVHRLRIAEWPLTPYLQWELHSLRIRHGHGEDIRVGTADQVARFEGAQELPEILIVGDDVMYQILYSDDGILCGAVAHSDSTLIAACRDEIIRLHGGGTPLPEYFERYVVGLAPPHGA